MEPNENNDRDTRPMRPIHDIYMPAMPSLEPIRALVRVLAGVRRRRRERQRLHALLEYDDARLADLGYRRADLRRALRLPSCCNAWAEVVRDRHGASDCQRASGETDCRSTG